MITHKLVLALVALTLPASSADAGTWKRLPAAPISPEFNARTSVWTGKEMLVFGRDQQTAQGVAVEAGDQAGTQGAGQHHDQPEQDFGEALGRVEIAIEERDVTTPLLFAQGGGAACRPGTPSAMTKVNQAFQPCGRFSPANS